MQRLPRLVLAVLVMCWSIPALADVVMVTGAFRGLGLTMTQHLLGQGHKVIAVGRNVARARANGLGPHDRLILIEADLADYSTFDPLIEKATAKFGGISAIVHNAANMIVARTDQLPAEDLERVTRVNFLGPVELTNRLMPGFERQQKGRIIYISSSAALLRAPEFAAYASSKAAAEAHFQTRAREAVANTEMDLKVTVLRLAFVRSTYDPKVEIVGGGYVESTKQRNFMATLRNWSPTSDVQVAAAVDKLISAENPPFKVNLGIDGKALALISTLPQGIQSICMQLMKGFLTHQ